jgi:hypothetical protein
MRTISLLNLFMSVGVLGACGAGNSGAEDPTDAKCPAGQSFQSGFCQVEQNVATAETPVAPAQQPTGSGGAFEQAPQEVASETEASQKETEGPAGKDTPDDQASISEASDLEEASPVDITMAAQAAPVIHYLSSSHLPNGSRQFGAPFAGQFSEGQVLTQKLQVTEGKCYTVVAVAMHPVSELNIQLFREGEEGPILEDTLKGQQAVIGSRGSCYKATATEALRLVVRVEKGNGVAAAQVFQK